MEARYADEVSQLRVTKFARVLFKHVRNWHKRMFY